MNKIIIVGIVGAVIVVAVAGAFLSMPQIPRARTIELEAKEFAFQGLDYKEFKGGPNIQVKPGETIRIVLKNSGGAPHEFMVIQKSGMNMGGEMEMGDEMEMARHEPFFKGAMTDEVKPGQTATITFVADKPGIYAYACLLDVETKPDRHADRGMFGAFIVQG